MKAKEMFEELGYECTKITFGDGVIIRYMHKKSFSIIDFDKKIKIYNPINTSEINLQLHKTITKQIEELGWLNG